MEWRPEVERVSKRRSGKEFERIRKNFVQQLEEKNYLVILANFFPKREEKNCTKTGITLLVKTESRARVLHSSFFILYSSLKVESVGMSFRFAEPVYLTLSKTVTTQDSSNKFLETLREQATKGRAGSPFAALVFAHGSVKSLCRRLRCEAEFFVYKPGLRRKNL